MKRTYLGFWSILTVAFALFFVLSGFDSITVKGIELRTSGMMECFIHEAEAAAEVASEAVAEVEITEVPQAEEMRVIDEKPQTILLIGDSMLEGLAPRMAAYADANGHTLYAVTWYSSTSEVWGRSTRLARYIEQFKPTYIFIALGANELFVRDIATRRDKYVKKILQDIGDIPYLWIGPPNWKPDTGINDLIEKNTKKGAFFLSNGMHFDRAKDGAHPTRSSAALWLDSVVKWMPTRAAYPIKMNRPEVQKSRPKREIMLGPDDK